MTHACVCLCCSHIPNWVGNFECDNLGNLKEQHPTCCILVNQSLNNMLGTYHTTVTALWGFLLQIWSNSYKLKIQVCRNKQRQTRIFEAIGESQSILERSLCIKKIPCDWYEHETVFVCRIDWCSSLFVDGDFFFRSVTAYCLMWKGFHHFR